MHESNAAGTAGESAGEIARRAAAKIHSEERLRFEVLQGIHEVAGGDGTVEVNAAPFAGVLGVPLERIFAVVEFLSREGYLAYRGAGPRVSLTRRGLDYLHGHSGRRGTLRD